MTGRLAPSILGENRLHDERLMPLSRSFRDEFWKMLRNLPVVGLDVLAVVRSRFAASERVVDRQ